MNNSTILFKYNASISYNVLNLIYSQHRLHQYFHWWFGRFSYHGWLWGFLAQSMQQPPLKTMIFFSILDLIPLHLCNTNTSTRLSTRGRTTSPDLTLISTHLVFGIKWVARTRRNFDPSPVIISIILASSVPPCRSHTFTNYQKANYSLSIFNWALRRGYHRRDLLGTCAKSCVRQILCSKIYTHMKCFTVNCTTYVILKCRLHRGVNGICIFKIIFIISLSNIIIQYGSKFWRY